MTLNSRVIIRPANSASAVANREVIIFQNLSFTYPKGYYSAPFRPLQAPLPVFFAAFVLSSLVKMRKKSPRPAAVGARMRRSGSRMLAYLTLTSLHTFTRVCSTSSLLMKGLSVGEQTWVT